MRSALFISLLLLFAAAAYAQPPGQAINPHTQIRWPPNCHELGARRLGRAGVRSAPGGMVYNFINNTCIDMNAIDPGKQLVWPTSCGANQVYVPLTNTCITNGAAANPAGNPMEVQFNQNGVFGGTTGLQYDNAGGIIATAGGVQGQSVGGSCYAKQWQNPGSTGNNGIANAMAGCVAIISDPTYSGRESITSPLIATRTPVGLVDNHGDYTTEYYRNPTTDGTGKPLFPNRFGVNTLTAKLIQCTYDMSPVGTNGYILNYCMSLNQLQLNPGWNWNAWQVGVPLTIKNIAASAGTVESIYVNQHVHAVGDNVAFYCYAYAQGGEVMGSAEGTKCLAWLTLEESNAYGGPLTGGFGVLNPTSIISTPNTNLVSAVYNYNLGAGRYAIPLGTCTSYPTGCPAAPFSGQMTSSTAGIDNVVSTIAVVPGSGTITQSTVYGKVTADINTPNNVQPPLFSTPMTVNVTIEGGINGASSQFNTNDLVCSDSGYHDCARPTSVSAPSGGVQQIVIPLRRQHLSVDANGNTTHLYQGGMAGYCLVPQAWVNTINANQPLRYCYDVFGSRMMTAILTSVTASSGGAVTYTGTGLTGFCLASNATQITVTGFVNAVNNGTFTCSSASATTATLYNPAAVAESGASATANVQLLQVGRFMYTRAMGFDMASSLSLATFLSPNLSSSGTVVTANIDLPGYHPGPGATVNISNSTGNAIDGQCVNVTYAAGSTSSFTCINTNLTGTHTSTNTATRVQPMNTACTGCATIANLTSWSVNASNVATFTGSYPSPFIVGQNLILSGFTTGAFFNNQVVTVTAIGGTPASGGYFQASFTHAAASAFESGTAGLYTAKTLGSYVMYPAAEVLDVRNIYTATSFAINSNVLTVQASPNNLAVGMQVQLQGFTTGTYLNTQTFTVTSASSTQFTAAFAHANVASTQDVGAVIPQPPVSDGTMTLEPNVFGTPASGSHIEEIHHISAQFQGHTEAMVTSNPFSSGYHDGYSIAVGGVGVQGGGYTAAAMHILRARSDNPDSMYTNAGGIATPPGLNLFTGAYYSMYYLNHFPDGGHFIGVSGAPSYQLTNPNFIAGMIGLTGRTGNLNWTYTPYSGDVNLSTNGNVIYGGTTHHFNGSVDITNNAGLISGMGINYAPYSNQITAGTSWGGVAVPPTGASTTCTITDDLGDPACTLVGPTSGSWNISDVATVGTYTALTLGAQYTVQARMKGAVGNEQVVLAANSTTGFPTNVLTTVWTDYCYPFIASRSASLTTLAQINQQIPAQTIYVSNVVVRPGVTCGPPIQTTNNQILTPTPVNKFPGTSMRAGSWTITSATSVTMVFAPPMTSAPASCAVTPATDPSAMFPFWVSGISSTQFTINAHTSGTISGTYLCAVNNSN